MPRKPGGPGGPDLPIGPKGPTSPIIPAGETIKVLIEGRIHDFQMEGGGGGGAQKIMCAQRTSQALSPKSLTAEAQGPLMALEVLLLME